MADGPTVGDIPLVWLLVAFVTIHSMRMVSADNAAAAVNTEHGVAQARNFGGGLGSGFGGVSGIGGYGGYGGGYGGGYPGGYGQGIGYGGGYGQGIGYGGGYGQGIGYGGGYGQGIGYGGGYGGYPQYGHGGGGYGYGGGHHHGGHYGGHHGGHHGGGLLGGGGLGGSLLPIGAALLGGVVLGKVLSGGGHGGIGRRKRDLTSQQDPLSSRIPEVDGSELFNFIVELEDTDFCLPKAVCEVTATNRISRSKTDITIRKKALKYLRTQPSSVLPPGYPAEDRLFSIGAVLGRTADGPEMCEQLFNKCKRGSAEKQRILDEFLSTKLSKKPNVTVVATSSSVSTSSTAPN